MKVHKLTTQDGKTRLGENNETQWGEGVEHVAPGGKPGECGEGWLHAYHSPGVAVMMNDVHAKIDNPICWECDADVSEDQGDKLLCTRIKTIRVVELPELTLEQRVEIAIRAAMAVYDDLNWIKWAKNWLNGADRSAEGAAAEAMAWQTRVARSFAQMTARAASVWAVEAAWAVARVAARAASAWAAEVARLSAQAAARAAAAAREASRKVAKTVSLDLDKIVNDVLASHVNVGHESDE